MYINFNIKHNRFNFFYRYDVRERLGYACLKLRYINIDLLEANYNVGWGVTLLSGTYPEFYYQHKASAS